jgi:hypothetical protein
MYDWQVDGRVGRTFLSVLRRVGCKDGQECPSYGIEAREGGDV